MTRKASHARHGRSNTSDQGTVPDDPTAENGTGAPDEPSPPADELPVAWSEEEVAASAARIAELERDLELERAQGLRVLADFQNYRRRNDEQRADVARFATHELIVAILPILDNFERAVGAASANESYEALIGGVQLIYRQLLELLQRHGVEPIDSVGKEFDPNLHEAMMRVEGNDSPDNTVVEEVRRGYTMHSRVIRPAMVKVASSG